MKNEELRDLEQKIYIAQQVAPEIWKSIRRDVIAGLALAGQLATGEYPYYDASPSAMATMAIKVTDALLVELDKGSEKLGTEPQGDSKIPGET